MNESEILLDKAKSYLTQHDIIFSDIELISHLGMRSKKNHVLVLSGFNILILTQKKVSKNIAKKYDKSIFDISSISITKHNIIEIQFAKTKNSNELKLEFLIEEPQKLVHTVINYIHRILAPFEFNRIEIDESSMPPILAPRTSHSVLSRLRLQLESNQIEVPPNLIQKISQHLYSHLNSFIFSKFRIMKKFFPIFFPCISMVRWVNQIDIYSPKHVFCLMFKQMNCFDNILHVKIRGTESKDLHDFIDQSKNINSISFHDRPVSTFDFTSDLIQNNIINSIGFDLALDETSAQTFIDLPTFQNLKYFRISNLSHLDFLTNFPKFRQLKVLSLTSCNLKVGEVFDELISNQATFLKKLDLSGNIGNGFQKFFDKRKLNIPNTQLTKRSKTLNAVNKPNLKAMGNRNTDKTEVKVSLPCKLEALFVNEVDWDVDQLIFFMNMCSNSVILNLSINSIGFINSQSPTNRNNERRRRSNRRNNNNNNNDNEEEEDEFDDDDFSDFVMSSSNENVNYNKKLSSTDGNDNDIGYWEALFGKFPRQMNSIKSLNWNSNKISNEFISFLLSSTRLNEVSFCGCNCSDIPFIEALLKKHHIQKVNLKQICFNTNLLYFQTFKNFLANIPQMTSVKQIDLSHNNIDDECFDTLAESLMNSTLEFIALDNSSASSYEVLNKFYHKLEKSKEQPITISYPFLDLQRLEVDQYQIFDFIKCFNNLRKPLSRRTTELQKYLSEVSYLRLDNNFPQFLPKDKNSLETSRSPTISTINQQVVPPNNNPNNNKNSNKSQNNQGANNKNRNNVVVDDDDDFPKPRYINSRNRVQSFNNNKKGQKPFLFDDNDTDSSDNDEMPKSTFKRTNSNYNNRKSYNTNNEFIGISPNRIISNFYTSNNNKSNSKSMRNISGHHRSQSVNNQSNIIYFNNNNDNDTFNSDNNYNSKNKHSNHHRRISNQFNTINDLSPHSANRQNDFKMYNNNKDNFMRSSRKNNDFMDFSPNSEKRRWSKREPENWKGRQLPAPPKIDNTEIFLNYRKEFSLSRLINKMSRK